MFVVYISFRMMYWHVIYFPIKCLIFIQKYFNHVAKKCVIFYATINL